MSWVVLAEYTSFTSVLHLHYSFIPVDLSLSGYLDVPLLRRDRSRVCEWNEIRLQFSLRTTRGGHEERSRQAVENFERHSTFSRYIVYIIYFPVIFFCFVNYFYTVFTVHAADGHYDYLTMSGREHIVRLTEAGSVTQILSHIQVRFSRRL